MDNQPFFLRSTNVSARLWLGAATITLLSTAGCTNHRENELYSLHNSVAESLQRHRMKRSWDHAPAPRAIAATLGEPEKTVPLTEFLELIDREAPETTDSFRGRFAAALTRYLDDQQDQQRAGTRPARQTASEEMKRCQVWLYEWREPDVVKVYAVGGTVIFVTKTSALKRFSYAYVIYDDHVIDWPFVERGQPRSE